MVNPAKIGKKECNNKGVRNDSVWDRIHHEISVNLMICKIRPLDGFPSAFALRVYKATNFHALLVTFHLVLSCFSSPCFLAVAFLSHYRNLRQRLGKRMASRGSASSSSSTWMPENGGVPHVLAVDDNLVDRKLVEKLLRNSSCKVTTAKNATRALEFLGLATTDHDEHNAEKGASIWLSQTIVCPE
ncbi:uncharacterized protein LOC129294087 [Prosopis cineraria]|uniref:uncharacterized protein LOC129294087 n=1 Tax=Prosopis cineraria TaxID=364024 RepID=UPI00240F3DC0|nr:uncharacterized protein LOC129294087 [Prosopis cineraria]